MALIIKHSEKRVAPELSTTLTSPARVKVHPHITARGYPARESDMRMRVKSLRRGKALRPVRPMEAKNGNIIL